MTEPRKWTVELLGAEHPALNLGPPNRMSGMGDEAAYFHLRREHTDCEVIARFTIDGEPVSKARARFTNYRSPTRAYTPEKTKTAENVVAWKFRAAARSHVADSEFTYGVMALFFSGTRQRRDVDNMLKLILDGLNGIAWKDDHQVSEVSARKVFEEHHPDWARTEVVVYRVGLIAQRTMACERCGKVFPTFECMKGRRRFCSRDCANAARRQEGRTVPCEGCGTPFRTPGSKMRYCSAECRLTKGRTAVSCTGCGTEFTKQTCHVRQKNFCSNKCRDAFNRDRRQKLAKGTCETCGGPTSKKSYRQCFACSRSGTKVTGKPVIPAPRPATEVAEVPAP